MTWVFIARSCSARFSLSPSGHSESTIQPMPKVRLPPTYLIRMSRRNAVLKLTGRPSSRMTFTPAACLPHVCPLCRPLRVIVRPV